MADRVYPTNTNVEFGSEMEYKGIDWSSITDRLASVDADVENRKAKEANIKDLLAKYAEDEQGLPSNPSKWTEAEFIEEFKNKVDDDVLKSYVAEHAGGFKEDGDEVKNRVEDSEEVEASSKGNHLKKFQFKKNKAKEEEPKDEKDEMDFREDEGENKEASTEKRVIKFTSASDINAEALLKAEKDGDLVLRDTILAARRDKRVAVAKKLLNDMSKYAFAEKEEIKVAAETKSASTEVKTDFVSAEDLTASQRAAFVKKASALGFPTEWTKNLFDSNTRIAEVDAFYSNAKEILSSNLSVNAKKAAINSLMKAAEYPIGEETKDRLVDYWKNEADYDPEGSDWLEELVSEKK